MKFYKISLDSDLRSIFMFAKEFIETMKYSIKQITDLAGVSARTLRLYDQTGLLKPASRSESRYRYYGERELLRLQQILFFRELDFSLKEIKGLLDDPNFDHIEALSEQKKALQTRQKRLKVLVKTIDRTIKNLNEKIPMKPEELYEGLPKEYREQAIENWGKTEIERSEKALMELGKRDFEALKERQKANAAELFELRNEAVSSHKVQDLVAMHYAIIRAFWGTSGSADKQQAYKGLGEMYVSDERYTTIDGSNQPFFAEFLRDAMIFFADQNLQEK
ncbi:MerR family transcriptional regulator [Jiulongibacter sediminis]|nr:MerR family transcriptional regulator [Jiulongibacter sediminis]